MIERNLTRYINEVFVNSLLILVASRAITAISTRRLHAATLTGLVRGIICSNFYVTQTHTLMYAPSNWTVKRSHCPV